MAMSSSLLHEVAFSSRAMSEDRSVKTRTRRRSHGPHMTRVKQRQRLLGEVEMPTSGDVLHALETLGGKAVAVDVCASLEAKFGSRRLCQLAIQRACEAGVVAIEKDWSLSRPHTA